MVWASKTTIYFFSKPPNCLPLKVLNGENALSYRQHGKYRTTGKTPGVVWEHSISAISWQSSSSPVNSASTAEEHVNDTFSLLETARVQHVSSVLFCSASFASWPIHIFAVAEAASATAATSAATSSTALFLFFSLSLSFFLPPVYQCSSCSVFILVALKRLKIAYRKRCSINKANSEREKKREEKKLLLQ